MRFIVSFTGLSALVGVLVACGPAGQVGEAVRPNAGTGRDAMGEANIAACVQSVAGEPLVVDLKSNDRSDLEVAMRDGVVVVGFDCKTLKILKGCSVPGNYRFAGVTRKEDVVRMTNADELAANLPLTGASISASMKRGSTVDLALVTVGKKRATAREITKSELVGGGACADATHVVRGVYVGAFALTTGTEGEARAVAQIFGAGTSGASSSAKKTETRDGDLDACRKSSPDSAEPPAQCAAISRLEIVPLVAAKTDPKDEAKETSSLSATVSVPVCPSGFGWDGLKCVSPKTSVGAAACSEATGTVAECETSCNAGNADSCFVLGVLAKSPPAAPGKPRMWADRAQTNLDALRKGCTFGSVRACSVGAYVVDSDATRAASAEQKSAAWDESFKLYDAACSLGDAVACRAIAERFDPVRPERGSRPKSLDKKFAYMKRGCDLGSGVMCGLVGDMHRDGAGAKQDTKLALDAYERQCTSGGYLDGEGCSSIGAIYASGKGVPVNKEKALAAFDRACGLHRVGACMTGYQVALEGNDTGRARALLERGCTKDVRGWDTCLALGDAYEKGLLGLQKDYAKAAEAFELGCAKGACKRAGDLYRSGGPNLPPSVDKAIHGYAQGCNLGDASACTGVEALLKGKGKKELLDFYSSRCENRGDPRACVKLKAAGGTPKPETVKSYVEQAKAGCQKDHFGDECKLWKDLGGSPTAAELAQPSREATEKKAGDERKKAAAKK